MKAYVKHARSYVLELDEEEAAWLRSVVQNPLHQDNPDAEAAWTR